MDGLRLIAMTIFVVVGVVPSSRADDNPVSAPADVAGGSTVDLNLKPLSAISTRIATPADETGQPHLPPNLAEPQFGVAGKHKHWLGQSRGWSSSDLCWTAPGLMHRPLYFEDITLERYGYSQGCLQPVLSGVRFASDFALLPYQMTLDHPCCPQFALGYDRPGDRVPYRCHRLPWDTRAAVVEGATLTGLAFLIPW
jgi:hypothetical protein